MKVSKADISLELDCWVDELSSAQLAAYEKVANEHNAIKNALKSALSSNEGKELFNGQVFNAYSFKGKVLQEIREATLPKKLPKPATVPETTNRPGRKRASNLVYLESSDDEDEIPLAKRMTVSPRGRVGRPPSAATPTLDEKTPLRQKGTLFGKSSPSLGTVANSTSGKASPVVGKGGKTSSKTSAAPPSKQGVDNQDKIATQNFRPSEISSVGGLVIGSDGKDGTKATGTDSKESKLQGKTFPSLVVLAKPWLKVKDMSATRNKLDSKVKLVLMLTPNKFTEWLIQEGLLKSEQRCSNHRNNELKLGVYSDAAKFPYTGGYVWISECCPMRFVSVFHGSLFEGAPHPPSCILKLIYHWSCQTNIQNVVQWVKVDNVYIKGVYTWLRAACTLAIHQKCKMLGGQDKFVEVGVISLGTTSQDGQQRQVKVEVLGVLDSSEKTIRLRAVEPVSDADRNYKKRFQTILEPLGRWVNKDSIIAIDLTVDKMTLYQMGFKNIVQAAANDNAARHTNSAVMDYLRRIVPRMFQNTLSLLSRQMIQQFLDELVWREQFGTYALQAFNNITTHLAEQTRMNTSDTLTQRLYQVATNPFKDWSVVNSAKDAPPPATTPKRLKKPINEADYTNQPEIKVKAVKKEPAFNAPSDSSSSKRGRAPPVEDDYKPDKKTYTKHGSALSSSSSAVVANTKKYPETKSSIKKDIDDDVRGLEELYYGVRDGMDVNFESFPYIQRRVAGELGPVAITVDCPICDTTESFDSNEKLQTHLVSHITIDGKDHQFQCLFCLDKHASGTVLSKHNQIMHPTETKASQSSSYHCLICQQRFNTLGYLTSHLTRIHNLLELPYNCQACGYSSSSHRDVVRHFYDDHKNQNFLQCPFCLQIFRFSFKGKLQMNNVEAFYMHLRQHVNKKESNLRCLKCALSFCEKGSLYQHLANHHRCNAKTPYGIRQMLTNSEFIGIPKTKSHHRKPIPYTMQVKFGDLYAFVEGGSMCAECDAEIISEDHYIGQMKCLKCQYQTCCERAMFQHSTVCESGAPPKDSIEIPLETEMHCICGFSTAIGNTMAHHLGTCGQKSAYLTVASTQENTVKRNMLDMLGLVRRDDEPGVEGDEGTASDSADGIIEQLDEVADENDESQSQQTDLDGAEETETIEEDDDGVQQLDADAIFGQPTGGSVVDDDQQEHHPLNTSDIDMPLIGDLPDPNPTSTPAFIGEVHTPMFDAAAAAEYHHNNQHHQ